MESWQILGRMLALGIRLNFVLVVFNLIPVPPLDGSHVLYHFLPPHVGMKYRELGFRGIGIVFLLTFFLPGLLRFPVDWLFGQAMSLVNVLV